VLEAQGIRPRWAIGRGGSERNDAIVSDSRNQLAIVGAIDYRITCRFYEPMTLINKVQIGSISSQAEV
jgi:hypothetical protein